MSALINIVIPPIPKPLTYEIPDDLCAQVGVGYRVEVPLGSRFSTGFIIEKLENKHKENLPFEVKSIERIRSSYPFFLPEQIQFFRWVADYYGTELSNVVDVAVPPWVNQKFHKSVVLVEPPQEKPRGKLEGAVLTLLQNANGRMDYSLLLRKLKGASAVIARWRNKGIVRIELHEVLDQHRLNGSAPAWASREIVLNQAQQMAKESICSAVAQGIFQPFLLHGVTGSGKTEVYLEVIRQALSLKKGALLIVPEIALTPQLIDRFRARLGDGVAVLHSALQKRTRWDAWRALLEGRCQVAIGARSGIFAPLQPLGVIIIDEEHDGSYKQGEGLRYNARDLALVRGSQQHCPVVLGSATPAMETIYNAQRGKYRLLSLPARPQSMGHFHVEVIDLNRVKPWDMPSKNISPRLHEALREVLEQKQQAFVLYNRRGFAAYLQCERCDTVLKCPNCSVTLTYHRSSHSLLCHYCNLNMVPPEYCSACPAQSSSRSPSESESPSPTAGTQRGTLVQRGAGTEKVFDELLALFPSARIDRLDRDAVQDLDAYRRILDRVRQGSTDILVGTQMIAKGHDLPGVTLVGIIDCDVGLHMPDFRAGERVFQLLTQASGRTGRGSQPGQVILQTRVPRHPSLLCTAAKNYSAFAEQELATRRALHYPPFTRILRILVSSTDKDLPMQVLEQLSEGIRQLGQSNNLSIQVLGPCLAPIEKIKTHWRAHLLVKSRSAGALHRVVRATQAGLRQNSRYRIVFDIDPQEML